MPISSTCSAPVMISSPPESSCIATSDPPNEQPTSMSPAANAAAVVAPPSVGKMFSDEMSTPRKSIIDSILKLVTLPDGVITVAPFNTSAALSWVTPRSPCATQLSASA